MKKMIILFSIFMMSTNIEAMTLKLDDNGSINHLFDVPDPSTIVYMAMKNDFEQVKEMAKYGGYVNFQDCFGWTALHNATKNGNIKMVKFLLKNNAYVNPKIKIIASPLTLASARGYLEIVKLLVKNGAEINPKLDPELPLHKACEIASFSIVKFLVENGADLEKKDLFDKFPLCLACSGEYDSVRFEKSIENERLAIIKFLIKKGAKITQEPYNDPLWSAFYNNYIEIAKYLVKNKANLNYRSYYDSRTPFEDAIWRNHLTLEQAKYFIAMGAKVSGVDFTSIEDHSIKRYLELVSSVENKPDILISKIERGDPCQDLVLLMFDQFVHNASKTKNLYNFYTKIKLKNKNKIEHIESLLASYLGVPILDIDFKKDFNSFLSSIFKAMSKMDKQKINKTFKNHFFNS